MHHEWEDDLDEELVEKLAQIDDALRLGAVDVVCTADPVLLHYLQDIRQELQAAWPSTVHGEQQQTSFADETQVDIPSLPAKVAKLGRFEIRSPLGGGG